MVMGYYYGTGDIAGIYIVANTVPVITINLIANGIATGFIPIYNKAKRDHGYKRAEQFTSNIVNIMMIFGTIIVIIGMIFAKYFCILISPDLHAKPDLLKIAVTFTRILMFAVYAYLYSAVFRGYLNLKGNFFIPVTTGIIMNVIIIFFIVLSGLRSNYYLLAVGALLGNTLQYLFFPQASRKLGFRYRLKVDFKDLYLREMLKIALPIIISVAAAEISLLVDNAMASAFFGNNNISVLNYAKKLLGIIYGVITVSVTTSIFPVVSTLASEGKIKKMKNEILSSMVSMLVLVVPAVVGIMALSTPVIDLVYKRGAFDNDSVMITSAVMFSYAPYILFQSVSDIMDRSFYAVEDSKTPVKIVLFQQVVNIILNLLLIRIFGLKGIAISTSLACLVGASLMCVAFRRRFGSFKYGKLIKSIVKIFAVSLIMGLIAKKSYVALSVIISPKLSLLVSIILAMVFYAIAIVLVRIPEVFKLLRKLIIRLEGKVSKRR